jgi:peptidoglycan/LPS O-acetylase OafA/YrhL
MNSARSNGLDTLRAIAIVLVLLNHEASRSHSSPLLVVQAVGWIGVDLFFVMSGYLIANQLLAGVNRGEALSLTAFYAPRLSYLAGLLGSFGLLFFVPIMDGRGPSAVVALSDLHPEFQLAYGNGVFARMVAVCRGAVLPDPADGGAGGP